MCPCRSTEEMFLSVGARIGYFQGDVKKLVDDIGTLRPTLFIGALHQLPSDSVKTLATYSIYETYDLCETDQGVMNPQSSMCRRMVCLLRRESSK